MKISKIFSFLMLLSAIGMVACSEKNAPSGPGGGGGGGGKDTSFVINIDTTKAISLQEAIAKANSSDTVVIKGYVSYAYATSVSSSTGRREQSAWIAEKATDKAGVIQAYYCTIKDSVAKGDFVAVEGLVTMHIKNATDTVYEIKNGKMQLFRKTTPAVTTGDGSESNPYTVADVMGLASTKTGSYFVKGYIVGDVKGGAQSISGNVETSSPFTSNTNILLASVAGETDANNMIPIQLPTGKVREGINLKDNPSQLGQEVLLYGSLENYFGSAGVKSISYAKVGDKEYGTHPFKPVVGVDTLTCEDAKKLALDLAQGASTDSLYSVVGFITELVGSVSKGKQTFWMADEEGTEQVFQAYYASLPAGMTTFTVGQRVMITGYIKHYYNSKDSSSTPEIADATVEVLDE